MVVSPSHHERKLMKVIDDVGCPARRVQWSELRGGSEGTERRRESVRA